MPCDGRWPPAWRASLGRCEADRAASATECGGSVTPQRLEAFSDGVFAIAATLLVLELKVPADLGSGEALVAALLAAWPGYAAFVVSFLTIGIMWINHHALIAHVRRVDRTLLIVNLMLLLIVSAVPFPTALVGAYIAEGETARVAAAVYGGLMVLLGIAFTGLWLCATRSNGVLGDHLDPKTARESGRLFSAGLGAYLLGIGLAFVSPPLSLAVYGLTAL